MPSRKFPPPPVTLILLAVRKKQKKMRPPAPPAMAKAKPPLATPHDQIVNDAWADLAAALEQEEDNPKHRHNADPWKRSPSRRNIGEERSSQRKKQPRA